MSWFIVSPYQNHTNARDSKLSWLWGLCARWTALLGRMSRYNLPLDRLLLGQQLERPAKICRQTCLCTTPHAHPSCTSNGFRYGNQYVSVCKTKEFKEKSWQLQPQKIYDTLILLFWNGCLQNKGSLRFSGNRLDSKQTWWRVVTMAVCTAVNRQDISILRVERKWCASWSSTEVAQLHRVLGQIRR